ncbi:hypothetical protein [Stygiolobus caldivivus]|uniref:Uncharacterized protein n=1 Tax=Stygiolobus caldivivus TaxID=2824673 RepID=A0A8D5U520_9CREN|nr:hypothetical protein [Stygiolobus caldivivus]BCU69596.1 hypothetical protein KN1_08930 [Stygiolobus caldivivus]
MTPHTGVGYAQKGDRGYVSPVSLGSRGAHDPPSVKPSGWLRAKSLYSIMIGGKMIEMKV